MKMVSSIVAALVMGPLLLTSSASASSCSITGPTGPDSNNTCTVNDQCTATTTNTNNINVSNNNSQNSSSGDSSSSGNTSAGGATSGSATNSSSTGVNIDITNGGASCNPLAVTTPTDGEGDDGQVSGSSTVAAAKSQVEAPVGGVGAGAGGFVLPLMGVSIASAAIGAHRLRKLYVENA